MKLKLPDLHIWDKIQPFSEDAHPLCFKCQSRMNLLSSNRQKLKYQCPLCHARLVYTTRNNERVEKLLNAFPTVFALGTLFGMWLLLYMTGYFKHTPLDIPMYLRTLF